MHTIRKWIRNIFGFSGREINGFLILLPLVIIIVFSQPVYHWWISQQQEDFAEDKLYLDSVARVWSQSTSLAAHSERVDALFDFDPNTVTEQDMQRLGFSATLSKRIASYRSKGGRFILRSDLLKIYGMDSTLYHRLSNYIQLPEKAVEKGYPSRTENSKNKSLSGEKPLSVAFDLNGADTTQLKSVYGVGSKLAKRIVNFREALGGFTDYKQVYEVYGLDSAVVNSIRQKSFISNAFEPRVIDLNSAPEKELASHPYIGKAAARWIITYRFQHGEFKDVESLKKIVQINAETFERMKPYLSVKK